jgi:hypothetical protein
MATFELGECMAQLWNAEPHEQLGAVGRLRELGDEAAGSDLLRRLEQELSCESDWELVHALIGALGACGFRPALGLLQTLRDGKPLRSELEEALGVSLVQLSALHEQDTGAVLEIMDLGRPVLTQGALQAMARMRMIPEAESMSRLVDFALAVNISAEAWSLIWILRAAPGWSGEARDRLIEHFSAPEFGQLKQVKNALDLAINGEYKRWGQF